MIKFLNNIIILLYSFSPGFAKLTNNTLFFIIGYIFFIIFLLLNYRKKNIKINIIPTIKYFLILFIFYAIIISLFCILNDSSSLLSVSYGFFIYLLPLIFGFYYVSNDYNGLSSAVKFAAFINAVVGIIIYPPITGSIPFISEIASPLLEGTALYRLSSVSGSLGMATLMIIGFSVSIRDCILKSSNHIYHYLNYIYLITIFIAGFLTLQRSAWLGLSITILVYFLISKQKLKLSVVALALGSIIYLVFERILPDGVFELIYERIFTVGYGQDSAIAERSDQWVNVFQNLYNQPLGYGLGQVGQIARMDNVAINPSVLPIFDGDYFRTLSEFGPFGLLIVIFIATSPIRQYLFFKSEKIHTIRINKFFILAMLLGLTIQCVGTNVTELYFVNTIFWVIFLSTWKRKGSDFFESNKD